MDGDDYDSGDSIPELEQIQPYFCLACNREIPCDHCQEGISRPFTPRSWRVTGFNGLIHRPMIIRRTSPPRSSPPCEMLRPASPCDLPELESHTSTTTLQEITIRPAPELKFESDTTTSRF